MSYPQIIAATGFGYVLTVLIETPVLLTGLSSRTTLRQRLVAGVILTAFSYPLIAMTLPAMFSLANCHSQTLYLVIAETFAPVSEVLLFRWMTSTRLLAAPDRDACAIVAANLCSFAAGVAGLSDLIGRVSRDIVAS